MAKFKRYYKADNIKISRYLRLTGIGCILLGFTAILYFFFPIIAYQMFLSSSISGSEIVSPVPKYLTGESSSVKSLIQQGISSLQFDYNDARVWYPQIHPDQKKRSAKIDHYSLSIPSLKIDDATVSTTNYNLDQNLVHYFGPSNPLDHGTSVIFGHSTIPQWFNPKNYKTIFATLHTIKTGDDIILTVEGKQYTYQIFSVTITSPEDVNIFSQSYDNSYITIVTCTPPGTIWKRLIVRAVLK
jgi:sortase A